jgi:hypothetical protein
VPNFWDPDGTFIEGCEFDVDNVQTNPVTGADYLVLSGDEIDADPTLTQDLTTVPGVTYDGYVSGNVRGIVASRLGSTTIFSHWVTTDHSAL